MSHCKNYMMMFDDQTKTHGSEPLYTIHVKHSNLYELNKMQMKVIFDKIVSMFDLEINALFECFLQPKRIAVFISKCINPCHMHRFVDNSKIYQLFQSAN